MEEEVKCQHMADLAQSDLNEAMPALEEAIKVWILNIKNGKFKCYQNHI